MSASHTLKNLNDVKDSAPGFGHGDVQDVAFGARHEGDGELLPAWWTD